MRNYIPIDKNYLPEQFTVELGSDTYIFEFHYNQLYDYFTVDLYGTNQEPVILGEKLILNVPLWQDIINDQLPAPTLIPLDESNQVDRITFDNFMVKTFLYVDDVPEGSDKPL